MLNLLNQVLRWWNRDLYSQRLLLAAILAAYLDEVNEFGSEEDLEKYFTSGFFATQVEREIKESLRLIVAVKGDLRAEGVDATRTAVKRLLIEKLLRSAECDAENWISPKF